MKKTIVLTIFTGVVAVLFFQITSSHKNLKNSVRATDKVNLIDKDSFTIVSRVNVPDGYKRVNYSERTFQNYLRNYKLKAFGSKIINYDNSEYFWQGGHIAILEIPVPKNGLQQCADALIRIRSEYLWETGRKSEIGFNFTSGHYCSWLKYAEGYRPKIKGNKVSFYKTAGKNYSKENFYKYLNLIYMYSGTLSLYNELPKITSSKDLKIGDMLIRGGSPGHIVMLCDEVINENGEKLFLLFQGNTPAQSVHLVKNLENSVISPWYKLEQDVVIPVSNYTFNNSKFVRFK
ncbi:DUF4846 domain-containing protein [Algibacter sp. L4_22]|uniref:DUF4846 domain-containing protein n=1 Tax=Algibacter sp. L4_22 TaxID=2942477 RepID=UPI00201B6CFF|nr:DUF4846 domain-containing protein [Algibacter sp. L4_22]MCL5128567.1 DUF4846 domain-containing protein [Algibacter sp. L4_22]